jgi:hypothetical protein
MDYLVRLLIVAEQRHWVVEIGCSGDAWIPQTGAQIAFRAFGKPLLFEVSGVVFYPGTDLPPVVITKPISVPDESVAAGFAASLSMICDGDRLVYRNFKEILEPS